MSVLTNFKISRELEDYESVIEGISKGITFKHTNLWILIFAILIASLGLNVNSTAVIIGAMLISPLMGPIMGIGLSLGIYDLHLLKRSYRNLLFATVVGLLTSTIFSQFRQPVKSAPNFSRGFAECLRRVDRPLADFRAYRKFQQTKGKCDSRVAIATALMPPLCTAGFGLATETFLFSRRVVFIHDQYRFHWDPYFGYRSLSSFSFEAASRSTG